MAKPALAMFMTPVVGVVCFAIILVSWFGGVKYVAAFPPVSSRSQPASLIACVARTCSSDVNFGGMSAEALKGSFQTFGFSVPHPVIGLVLGGLHWSFLKIILVTAIPFSASTISWKRWTTS